MRISRSSVPGSSSARRAEHGYGVLLRIEQITGGALLVEQGALYPALYRLESQGLLDTEWGTSDNNRKAKFYSLTAAGWKRLKPRPNGGQSAPAPSTPPSMRRRPDMRTLRSLWRGLFHRSDMERHELAFHIEARTLDLVQRHGLSRAEAERRARIEFGSVEKYTDEQLVSGQRRRSSDPWRAPA